MTIDWTSEAFRAAVDAAVTETLALCRIPSPTGFTRAAEDHVVRRLEDAGLRVRRTRKGSIRADIGNGEGDRLLLAAHIDTLGAMVRSVKGNGRLRLTLVGGSPFAVIETENCLVHTRRGKTYSGVIQIHTPSTHVNNKMNDEKRSDETIEVFLDEHVSSRDDVLALGIQPGDFVSFDPRTTVTDSGFIKSRHLDDKASAAVLVALAKLVGDGVVKPSRAVSLLFTTYEEVGHGGAAGIPGDTAEMIAVDMGCVGDDLQGTETKVSICAKDSSGPYDYDVTTALARCAEEHGADAVIDTFPYYGSDASVALRAGNDIKHGLIGPGVFASHGYERTHRLGIEHTLRLLAAYIHTKA